MKITINTPRRLNAIIRDAEKRAYAETGIRIRLIIADDSRNDVVGVNHEVKRVAAAVAYALGVSVEALRGISRAMPECHVRQIAMYLCDKYLQWVPPRIVAKFFNRDRTIVIHSRHVVLDMIATHNEDYVNNLKIAEQAVIRMLNETKDNIHTT